MSITDIPMRIWIDVAVCSTLIVASCTFIDLLIRQLIRRMINRDIDLTTLGINVLTFVQVSMKLSIVMFILISLALLGKS